MAQQMITHVAIRFDGRIWSLPRPYRHHHIIRMICWLDHRVVRVDGEQGFLDDKGQFLTRAEAEVVAAATGQIRNGKIIGGVLTSEDLW